MTDPLLQLRGVGMSYPTPGRTPRPVLSAVDFDLPAGRAVAVVGRSGSGKSTLLNVAAGLDAPTAGVVRLDGRDLGALDDRARTLLRRERIGFVFQFFHLLPHLSVLENVALPAWIAGDAVATWRPRALELLDRVGLADRAGDSADRLSGGEKQRTALCRALLRRPALLLADEPTGSLDDVTGKAVMDLLLELVRDEGAALLMVTHSRELAALADEVRTLHDGRLEPA
jgi:predicted ABC-type transport system involved in lysophospholipase L1 biosynthesis ATPase subunit